MGAISLRLHRLLDARFLRVLVKDSALSALSSALSRLFVFVGNVVVARTVVDPARYGAFSWVLLVVQVVAVFVGLGLNQTAAQAVAAAAKRSAQQSRVVRSTLVALGVSSLSLLALGTLAVPRLGALSAHPLPPDALWFGLLLLVTQVASGGVEGTLRGLGRYRVLTLSSAVALAVGLLALFPLVRAYGISGALAALALFHAAQLAVMLAALRPHVRGDLLPWRELRAIAGALGAPMLLNGIAWNVATLVPPLLLGRGAEGLAQLAIWNAATQLRFVLSFAPVVIAQASMPRLAQLYAARELRGRQAWTSILLTGGSALIPYLPVLAVAGPLMGLYGDDYRAHAHLLVLVASFVLLQVVGAGFGAIMISSGRAWSQALPTALWSAAVALATPWSVAHGGAYGLARLYLVTYVPMVVLLGVLAARAMRPVVRTPVVAEGRHVA